MTSIDQRAAAIGAASEAHEAAHEAVAAEYVADCYRGDHAAATQKAKAARLAADVAFRKAIDEIDIVYPVSVAMPADLSDAAIHPAVAACAAETTDEGKTTAVLRWAAGAENACDQYGGCGCGFRLERVADEIDPREVAHGERA